VREKDVWTSKGMGSGGMASIMAEVYGLVLMEIGIVYWGSEVLRVTSAYGDRYDG
jgi:hypothetical protein